MSTIKNYIIKLVIFYVMLVSVCFANIFSTSIDIKFLRENNDTNIKEQALSNASKSALKNVLYKIVLLPDADKIDNLLENTEVNNYVYGFTINNEDVGRNFYNATIDFTFNQNLIVDLLRDNSIRFVWQPIEKTYLVVPYFTISGALAVNNAWSNIFTQSNISTLSELVRYNFSTYSSLNNNSVKGLLNQSKASDIFLLQLDVTDNVYKLHITSVVKNKVIYVIDNIKNPQDAYYKAVMYMEAEDRAKEATKSINGYHNTYLLKINFIEFNTYLQTLNLIKKSELFKEIVVNEFVNQSVTIEVSSTYNLSILKDKLTTSCLNLQEQEMIINIENNCDAKL